MTLGEALDGIGRTVTYRPTPTSSPSEVEVGVITSVGPSLVFVRYGRDLNSQATHPRRPRIRRGGSVTVHQPASLPSTASAGSWRDQAACLNYPPNTMFPETVRGPAAWREAAATRICLTECPAASREACDQHADDTNQRNGVWGGLTQKQRQARRIARLRAKKKLEQQK